MAIRRLNLAGRLVLASVGPITAAPLEAAGLNTLVPGRWRLGAVVRELVTHYAEQPPIETVAGKAAYVERQRAFSERSTELRRRILEVLDGVRVPSES